MNAKRDKNAIQVYIDEDPIVKAPHLPAVEKTTQARKPFVDVYQFPRAKIPSQQRFALAEISACTNNVQQNSNYIKVLHQEPNYKTGRQVLAKPQNKFFKHKWVPVVQIPDMKLKKNVDVCKTDSNVTTIWSPLENDSDYSGDPNVPVESPVCLEKGNYCFNDSPEIFLIEEFSNEIYSHLLNLEMKFKAKPRYMTRQPDITSNMRSVVVDWLVEVCEEYKLETETLYLTVSYLDRFLSTMSVVRSKLQLVGTASLFIASKFEEIYPPDLKEFVYITDDAYTKRQVLRMEQLILDVLTFDLAVPTAYSFLERLISYFYIKSTDNEPKRTACLSKYLCELSLLDGDTFLHFLPSQIACAAFALAKYTMGQDPWNKVLEDISGYEVCSFKECVFALHKIFLLAPDIKQKAICLKYKSPKYNCVSLITPPPFVTGNL